MGSFFVYRFYAVSAAYFLCLSIMVFVGVSFESMTQGFAARGIDGAFYCRGLVSTGGDDDAMAFAFALFVLSAAVRAARFRRRATCVEFTVWATTVAAVVVALFVASLDCAEVIYTAFGVPNPQLAMALLAIPVSGGLLVLLKRMHPDQKPR